MARYHRKPYLGKRTRPYGLTPVGRRMLHQRRDVYSDADAMLGASSVLPDREKTVCFTGHRRLRGDRLQTARDLCLLLETLYQQGYRDFVSGGALGFDQLAAECVIRMRQAHPDVRLVLALPCPDQSQPWTRAQTEHYERLLYLANRTVVLHDHYFDGCMQARNRFMVDHASLCVAYLVSFRHSGTYATLRYALTQDLPIVNIAVPGAVQAYIRQSGC